MTIALANTSSRWTDVANVYTSIGHNVYATSWATGSYVIKYLFNDVVIYTLDEAGNANFKGNVSASVISANTLLVSTLNVSNLVVGGNTITSIPTDVVKNNSTTFINTGYTVNSFNAASNLAAFGTWTPDPANGNYQIANTNGALIIAAPAANCAIDVLIINGPTTGAITFSGYTVGSTTGDSYTTTAVSKFMLSIRKIGTWATYVWKALQ